jgi:replicative DNA helicase
MSPRNGAAVADRVSPPHDLEAEESVLGAALLSQSAYDAALDTGLTGDDFYKPAHAHVWHAVTHLVDTGTRPDPITVTARLRDQGLLDDVGGPGMIASYQAATPSIGSAGPHAQLVIDTARLRRLMAAAGEILTRTSQPVDDVAGTLNWAENLIQTAVDHTAAARPATAHQMMVSWLESLVEARPQGVPTPWDRFNEITGGLRPGLNVFFARPGTGKSAVGLNLAEWAAAHGHPTLLCSLEMGADEIQDRLVSLRTGLNHTHIRDRALGNRDLDRVSAAAAEIAPMPLHVLDDADLTVARIASAARRIQGLKLLIVDYAQLITPPPGRHDNREQQVSAISKALIRLYKQLRIPIVALAQSKRPDADARKNRRPLISEIRESGSLENDAHLVVSLYRDEMYDPKTKDRNLMELHIHKQRNGPSNKTVKVAWDGSTFRVSNLARQPDEEI